MESLYDVLKKNKRKISFHTPGGKLPRGIAKLDTTELSYSDNLLNAKGVIKDLEQELCGLYGAKKAYISTNGATSSILTAIYAVRHQGSFLIVGDAHSSIYNGIKLSGAKCFNIENFEHGRQDLPDGIGTIIITSPDYFGNIKDLESIMCFAKSKNILMIVDASHASHYVFHSKFPPLPSIYGDITVYSLHKTLAVATGGAALLCNNESIIEKLTVARKLFHSTSPSYITLASIDKAIRQNKQKLENKYQKVYEAVKRFKKIPLGCFRCKNNHDFSRLVIESRFDGNKVNDELMKKGIAMEMGYKNCVVAIVTPYNYKKLKKLSRVLKNLSNKQIDEYIEEREIRNNDIKQVFSGGDFEMVSLEDAEGKAAFSEIGIYPPGVPLVKAGEKISKQSIDIIKKNVNNCFGLENGTIAVISYNDGGK